jgi:hypothetical protein
MHQHSSELRGSEILEVGGLRNENYKLKFRTSESAENKGKKEIKK